MGGSKACTAQHSTTFAAKGNCLPHPALPDLFMDAVRVVWDCKASAWLMVRGLGAFLELMPASDVNTSELSASQPVPQDKQEH